MSEYSAGMVGLGTMGHNLLLNMAGKGFSVAGYDRLGVQVDHLNEAANGLPVKGFHSLPDFVKSLASPRVIVLLVPAGKIVDAAISDLIPFLDKGDILIDSGNSHFSDTTARVHRLQEQGFHFFGMGISGGEEGARVGASMMPGGDMEAYRYVKPLLEAVAARVNGEPCVSYIGPGASGHFVKMVHNGIEYAMMQLIADTYEFLRRGLRFDNSAIHKVFYDWNEGRLKSYLLEITADIFLFKESGSDEFLIDQIRDQAKSKGTGKWTTQVSTDLELPVPTIDMAVVMRDLSKYKQLRTELSDLYHTEPKNFIEGNPEEWLLKLEKAFYFSMINIYAQGMHLLRKASVDYSYNLNLYEISKIWRGGCIIRASLLEILCEAFQKDGTIKHLLLDSNIQSIIKDSLSESRELVSKAMAAGISIPAFAATLSYFESITHKDMPANLIQAQRDYFGAHTYELIGRDGVFHTDWTKNQQPKI